MYELSVALKYLIPRKKQLSVSLIALLSVGVISLVVWLVLVFLSVTEGIERAWVQKLTTLNAPLRITPTHHYYDSYYYQIDSVSGASQYLHKNIGEKAQAHGTDPYNPQEDGELPAHFPTPDFSSGQLKDPVKGVFSALTDLKKNYPDLVFQDFELSGALMRLQLLRPNLGQGDNQGYLTQVSYLASFPDRCPGLTSLLLPPSEKDLNHQLYLASHSTDRSRQDSPALVLKASSEAAYERVQSLLQHVHIKQLKPRYSFWQISPDFLPEQKTFIGTALYRNGQLSRIDLPTVASFSSLHRVKIWKKENSLFMEDENGKQQTLSPHIPLLISGDIPLNVDETSLRRGAEPLLFKIHAALQGAVIHAEVGFEGLDIHKAEFLRGAAIPTALPVNEEKETGVLLAKSFLDNGVFTGDRGYLSYSSTTASSVQEHRLPIFVAGFYDPGILSVGNKCILVPPYVTRTINASSSSFNLDKTQANGILVWFKDLEQAEAIKDKILASLADRGLDSYWKVTTFREYDFAKDLMQQFQSDKYLFTLVGAIILLVACCNIISLLVLLVNDKKREIGILQAMGASKWSIAAIFGICGTAMGILSSVIGTAAALFTLQHIDAIVHLLSFIQGHDAFNTAFFGKSLPDQLSSNAVTFVLIATPFLSLLAGLVPAIKACRLRPSAILRSE